MKRLWTTIQSKIRFRPFSRILLLLLFTAKTHQCRKKEALSKTSTAITYHSISVAHFSARIMKFKTIRPHTSTTLWRSRLVAENLPSLFWIQHLRLPRARFFSKIIRQAQPREGSQRPVLRSSKTSKCRHRRRLLKRRHKNTRIVCFFTGRTRLECKMDRRVKYGFLITAPLRSRSD